MALLHVAFLSVLGLSAEATRLRGGAGAPLFAFDYARQGQDWSMGKCMSRTRQSPVDFGRDDLDNPTAAGALLYHYNPVDEPFRFENDGHTISAVLSGFGYGGMAYEDAWYDVVSVNIHAVSEHTFQGQHLPVEMQLVHKRADGEALLVVALPFSSPNPPAGPRPDVVPLEGSWTGAPVAAGAPGPAPVGAPGPAPGPSPASVAAPASAPGPAPVAAPAGAPGPAGAPAAGGSYVPPPPTDPAFNPTVQPFLWVAPPAPQTSLSVQTNFANTMDLNQLIQGGTYLEYHGSLTAPPCSDIVTWLVRSQPLMASDAQVNVLMGAIYATNGGVGNYRGAMPLGGRELRSWTTTYAQDPLAAAATPANMLGGVLTTTREPTPAEVDALKQARHALANAQQLTEHVDGIEKKLLGPTFVTTTTSTQMPIAVAANAIDDAAKAAIAQSSQTLSSVAETVAAQAAKEAVDSITRLW